MFIGHIGAAMGLKKAAPDSPFGTLLLAANLPDVLFPPLFLAGVEKAMVSADTARLMPFDFPHYPWSHSLLMVAVWGALLGGAFWIKNRNLAEAGVILLAALSHWALDFISHRPDMPLWPAGAGYGLGLWDSLPGILAVEGGIFIGGTALFLSASKAKDRTGKWAFWGLVLFLVPLYFLSLFSPPPADMKAFGYSGIAGQFILASWGYWIDRHRLSSPAVRP